MLKISKLNCKCLHIYSTCFWSLYLLLIQLLSCLSLEYSSMHIKLYIFQCEFNYRIQNLVDTHMRVFSMLFVCDMIWFYFYQLKKRNYTTLLHNCDLCKESALNTGTYRIQFTIKMSGKTRDLGASLQKSKMH